MNVNKYFLAGRLTRDIQLRYTPNQTEVAEFGMATNRRWTGKDGQKQEEVLYIECVMFGKRADVLNRYVVKGDPLWIEGHLRLDQWEQQDGLKRSKIIVVVDNFEFVSEGKQEPKAREEPKPKEDEDDVPF